MSTADVHHEGPWAPRPGGRAWLRVARQTHNPLLRRPTPKERLVKGLGLALLAVVVVVTGLGCAVVLRSGLAAERAQAGRRPVTVTVVRQLQPTASGNVYFSQADVEVSYQVDGVDRVSTLPTLFGASPGAELEAWVDHDGQLAPRPQNHTATMAQTLLAGFGGLVLLVSLALGGQAAFKAWSLRLRAEEWEAEWLLFDTGRTR
jgi:hypothetical protein